MSEKRRNLGSFANVVFEKFNSLEKVQILNFTTNFVEGSNNLSSANMAFIKDYAIGIGLDEALCLDRFCKYCKSKAETFNITDIITPVDFKLFARHTTKACATNDGLCKIVDGQKYFFCVYRQISDGKIMGCWLPYEQYKNELNVTITSKEEAEKKALEAKKRMFAKLQKELGM